MRLKVASIAEFSRIESTMSDLITEAGGVVRQGRA